MKIYLAGVSTQPEITNHHNNFLESYIYFKSKSNFDLKLNKWRFNKNLFLDSGAFTAFSLGIKIDIKEYIEFIKEVSKSLELYANLDQIGNAEKTLQNWLKLKSEGLNPLPVVHLGSDLKYFDIYINTYKVKYLALGGLVPYIKQKKIIKSWLDKSYLEIKRLGIIKTHLFGVTTDWILNRYPCYSSDSTGWLAGGKFNNVKGCPQIYKPLNYKRRNIMNVLTYNKMESYYTKLWEKRGIVWD